MSTCCSEPSCRRKTPLRFYLGDLSGLVYTVTRSRLVKDHGDGTGTLAAVERHEVTSAMRQFLVRHAAWVRGVLADDAPPESLRGVSVWVAETWSAHGEDKQVLGVYATRHAAVSVLKGQPNMTAYLDEDGHVKARPKREPSFNEQVIAYVPVKWGRAYPAEVQTG